MTQHTDRPPVGGLEEALARARVRFRDGHYEEAASLFAQLATAPAGYAAEGQYGLGMISLVGGRLAEAEVRLHDCLRLNPEHNGAMAALGDVARHRRETAAAHQWYAAAAARGNRRAAAAQQRLSSGPGPSQTAAQRQRVLARQPSGRGISGRVSSLQLRQESRGPRRRPKTVVAFRVERDGRPPVPVELHGEVLRGSLSQGDTVEVPQRFARGKPVDALTSMTTFGNYVSFWNLETGEKVRVGYTTSTVIGITLGWCLLALVVVFLVALVTAGAR